MNSWNGNGYIGNMNFKPANGEKKAVMRYTVVPNDRRREDANFLPCVAFGGTAEFLDKYFETGKAIEIINGVLSRETWTDKDGNKRYDTVIYTNSVEFALVNAGKNKEDGEVAGVAVAEANSPSVKQIEDVPF